jgi:hypothetical protein
MTDRRRRAVSPRHYEMPGSVIHPADQRWLRRRSAQSASTKPSVAPICAGSQRPGVRCSCASSAASTRRGRAGGAWPAPIDRSGGHPTCTTPGADSCTTRTSPASWRSRTPSTALAMAARLTRVAGWRGVSLWRERGRVAVSVDFAPADFVLGFTVVVSEVRRVDDVDDGSDIRARLGRYAIGIVLPELDFDDGRPRWMERRWPTRVPELSDPLAGDPPASPERRETRRSWGRTRRPRPSPQELARRRPVQPQRPR